MPNLLLRVAVAAVGIPLFLYLARHGGWPLRALVLALQLIMLYEWHRLWSARRTHLPLAPLVLATVALDLVVFTAGHPAAVASAAGISAAMLLAEVYRSYREPLSNLGAAALFLLYVVLPLALWASLDGVAGAARFAPVGALASLLAATWMCDSGAYFVGRAWGRHKLYPAASPNKTVEGFIGGIIAAAIVVPATAALRWGTPAPWDYAALPLIVGVLGQSGDLLESLMKRETQIKDTSAILPGHGGLLDRFDSLLLSTPFFFAYLVLTSS